MRLEQVEPYVLKLFAEHIKDQYRIQVQTAPQTWRPLRASLAGTCSRRLNYRIHADDEIKAMEVIDEPSALVNFAVGNFIHQGVQDAWMEHSPRSKIEVPFSVGGDILGEEKITGHADIVTPEFVEVMEVKTTGGVGFKSMFGLNNWQGGVGKPPPPRYLLQAGLAAYALGAKSARIVIISKEAISKSYAEREGLDEIARWGLEFICEDTEYLHALGEWEVKRMQDAANHRRALLPHSDDGMLIEITNPKTGAYEYVDGTPGKDKGWVCQYCSLQERCIEDWPS